MSYETIQILILCVIGILLMYHFRMFKKVNLYDENNSVHALQFFTNFFKEVIAKKSKISYS